MKDILIIANFVSPLDGEDNSRFTYLAQLLQDNNEVELLTSDFSHIEKAQRGKVCDYYSFKVTFVHEPGYRDNVSLKRFRSHRIWGRNVKTYLLTRKKPDIIYCAVPSLTATLNAAKYCDKSGSKFIIDIQDLWPEAFQMVFRVPILSNIIFEPFKIRANRIYKSADRVIAVSQTYLDRAMNVNTICETPAVIYLGTEKEYFDQCANRQEGNSKLAKVTEKDNIIRIAYVGTLGYSYDVALILKAVRLLPQNIQDQVQIIIMGDGPIKQQLEQQAHGLPVLFTGRLSYPDMVWLLTKCDIAVNPIVKGAAQSITNKQMDYAMAGLPVINTQESKEYRGLLEQYGCGINCDCGNVNDVKAALIELIQNSELREKMGTNARQMGEENFDREKTYKRLAYMVLKEDNG